MNSASEHYHPIFEGTPEGTHRWFDSIEQYVEWADQNKGKCGKENSVDHSPEREWDFGLGYAGCLNMARTGWSEGAQKVEDLVDRVDQIVRHKMPNIRLAVRPVMVGGRVSVPAYLSGHPKQYLTLKREAATCKTVTINFSGSVSGSVDANTIMYRGVAIAALVRALERRRVKVELVLNIRSMGNLNIPGDNLVAGVCIKRAADKLMPDSIAYAMAHPAFLRRHGFAFFEGAAASVGGCVDWGYGRPYAFDIPGAVNIQTMPVHRDSDMQTYVEQQLKTILEMP